jgi:signal transduction histidine kinase
MRQEFLDYAVRPEGDREEYHAIIYLEPFDDRNKRAFGYDMRSEPTRQVAMDLARDTGLTTLSGKVKLVQETESDIQAGFLMYVPIYNNGKQIETAEQRRDTLKGFVYAPFRMNNFMAGILGATQQDITFVICDVNADPQNLMYDYSLVNGIKNDEIDQSLSKSIIINTNQRPWVLKFTALKSIHSQLEILVPTLVLLTGISLSILLFFIFRTYYRIITLTQESVQNEKMVAIGELAARLAHDIRNPLSSIIMRSELLHRQLKNNPNEKMSDYTDSILKSTGRIKYQLDTVMDFVRTKPVVLSMNSVLTLISESIKTTLIPESIQINLPKNDLEIECDRSQLVVVFSNLISNAIQAIGEIKGSITINVETKENRAIIEFIDSGPGISKENLPKIFEPLFTTKQTGTGLGLVSCKNIIEQHHGKISVKNNPTTFTTELPIKQ